MVPAVRGAPRRLEPIHCGRGGEAALPAPFIAAILTSLGLLLAGLRLTMAGGLGTALIFLMDEMDDEVFTAFFLWGAVVACRYVACVLQSKAELLARPRDGFPTPPIAAEQPVPPKPGAAPALSFALPAHAGLSGKPLTS